MHDASDWTVFDAAFDRALSLDGPDRDAFLASLDAATQQRLEPLLADALRDDPLLDHPDVALEAMAEALTHEEDIHAGTRVGPYRIEGLVGEGGMGRVFRARRDDGAFDQTVALKVVRHSLALAGSDVAARLRRERDLLAVLDHVGIARLLDGGETDDGVPYLVTEFVDGTAITDYADAHDLGVEARIRLMVDVARAVDHAHRRFVVHRDLKPSNVLVAERDGAPRPVVLDFGIAKLLDAADEATGAFPITRTGMRMLTPAYAAPELYEPTATVTTAADVYGLGALLYELLTGRRPHDDAPVPGPPTKEPTRPSRVVTQPTAGQAFDGEKRSKTLVGDLDVICLKALHPDPMRRYASAAEVADDLERHLSGRPVEARPDSAAYVASRYVRRHRGVVTAAMVALVALVMGLSASLVSLRNERAARQQATEAAQLFASLLQNATPRGDGQPVTVREALDAGLDRIAAVESDELRAYLFGVMGDTYAYLSEPGRADSLLAESLALYGDEASDPAVSRLRLGYAATRDAFADYETSLALGRRVYEDQKASGFTSPLTIHALSVMSRAHLKLGQFEEGLLRAEEAAERADANGHTEQLSNTLIFLGNALSGLGRHDEAVRVYREAVRRSVDMYTTSNALSGLGAALNRAGRFREAEAPLRRSAAYERRAKGSSIGLGYILASIGEAKLHQSQYRDAAAVLDSAVTIGRRTLPPDHLDLRAWLIDLAESRNGSVAYPAAEAVAREALTRAEEASDSASAIKALDQLGRALDGRGQRDAARDVRQRATRIRAGTRRS